MIDRLAKFNELVPSSLPFVEGRLEGHKERKNYTIIGRGVAEDTCLLYTSDAADD